MKFRRGFPACRIQISESGHLENLPASEQRDHEVAAKRSNFHPRFSAPWPRRLISCASQDRCHGRGFRRDASRANLEPRVWPEQKPTHASRRNSGGRAFSELPNERVPQMTHNTADIRRIHCRSDGTLVRKRSNDGIFREPRRAQIPRPRRRAASRRARDRGGNIEGGAMKKPTANSMSCRAMT